MAFEEAAQGLDELETNVMLRAQEEGLPVRYVQAHFRVTTAKTPPDAYAAFLGALGYGDVKRGKPNLCVGTDCFCEADYYMQLWNEKKDGVVIIENLPVAKREAVLFTPGQAATLNLYRIATSLYFAGTESALRELGVGHKVMKCPKTGKSCNQNIKLYTIGGVENVFFERFGVENSLRSQKLIEEEMLTAAQRVKRRHKR